MATIRQPDSGRKATVEESDQRKQIEDLAKKQVPTVIASAASWQKGVGGLLGVVLGTWAFGFSDTLSKLTDDEQQKVIGLVGGSVTAALFATVLFLYVSGGWPSHKKAFDITQPGVAAALAKKLILTMRIALGLTGLSILTFYGAVALAWTSQKPAATSVTVLTVAETDGEICGTLTAIVDGLVFIGSGDSAQRIELADVMTIETKSSCP